MQSSTGSLPRAGSGTGDRRRLVVPHDRGSGGSSPTSNSTVSPCGTCSRATLTASWGLRSLATSAAMPRQWLRFAEQRGWCRPRMEAAVKRSPRAPPRRPAPWPQLGQQSAGCSLPPGATLREQCGTGRSCFCCRSTAWGQARSADSDSTISTAPGTESASSAPRAATWNPPHCTPRSAKPSHATPACSMRCAAQDASSLPTEAAPPASA